MDEIKNGYDVDIWSVKELIESLNNKPINGKRVFIPRFQRNLVWSNNQKNDFIRSVKARLPFGALLLAFEKIHEDQASSEYRLLDGLQRTATLQEHLKNPNSSFEREEVTEQLILDICSEIGEDPKLKKNQIVDVITKWIKSKTGFEEKDGFSSYELAKEIIISIYGTAEENGEKIHKIVRLFVPFLSKVKLDADISDTKIPIILYEGPKSNLPIIFEIINTKGTKLSKYQIFASTWQDIKVNIMNENIINFIQAKYEALIEQGFNIENYDEDTFKDGQFNLFEYIYGFGKLITNNYPFLFGETDQESADSIGFNLYTICHDLRINEMAKLPYKLNINNINKYEDSILDSIDFVFKSLKPYITLQVNKRNKKTTKNRVFHTEYHIIAMIAKAFYAKFDSNLDIKKTWNKKKDLYRKTFPQHYLLDLIRDVWRGSGDSRIIDVLETDEYEKQITEDRWNTIFDEWFTENQLTRKETKRINIRNADYLFLNFIYTYIMKYKDVTDDKIFEIEHIVPIERLKKICGDGLPMSAISNLCFLPEKLNREKGSKTIYEYFDHLVRNKSLTEDEINKKINHSENYSLTSKEQLEFINSLDEDKYKKFLYNRFDTLKKLFIEYIKT